MKLSYAFSLSGLLSSSAAVNLYVSSYAGNITTIQLSLTAAGSYSLDQIAFSEGCSPNPSWLTRDEFNGVLYCLDEGLIVPNGSITAFSTSPSGQLTEINRNVVISGPVSGVVFNGGKALAAAHYTGSSVSTYTILPTGGLEFLQSFTFVLDGPGTIPARQDAPHPHEVILDPTGEFIVVPDLGADLIRVFYIDPETSLLCEKTPVQITPGAGPRHGAFLATPEITYFFLVAELDNLVRTFGVTYGAEELVFDEVFESSIYGNRTIPTAAAAEAVLSPNGEYLLTSSRNATLFDIANFDPNNSTLIPSDTLQSWLIDPLTGDLTFQQLAPAGGSYPRQFSLNKAGTLAAVGLQLDSRVVVIEVLKDGTFGDFLAAIDLPGQITSVIWDE